MGSSERNGHGRGQWALVVVMFAQHLHQPTNVPIIPIAGPHITKSLEYLGARDVTI